MSNYGFVYILANEYMPDLIKIGCTERAPRARADELSKHTGVPAPFRVLCYAEFDEFQAVERNMHEWCKNHRVNSGREFFRDCLEWAVQLLWFNQGRLSFTDATLDSNGASDLMPMICDEHQLGFDYLRNPWGKKEEEDERQARYIRNYSGDWSDEETASTIDPDAIAAAANALLKATADTNPTPAEVTFEAPDVLPWESVAVTPPLKVVGGTEA